MNIERGGRKEKVEGVSVDNKKKRKEVLESHLDVLDLFMNIRRESLKEKKNGAAEFRKRDKLLKASTIDEDHKIFVLGRDLKDKL